MNLQLSPVELRILGALIEKEATTPENYPLSLNALGNACNQKTNRDPVMSLSDSDVLDAVENLVRQTLAARRSSAGSRVEKYAHRLSNRLTDENNFESSELAVLCVLMLRGPQTLGEIRTRSTRLYEFTDSSELERAVTRLAERDDGPFVARLARQPGHKESRYTQLLGGSVEASEIASDSERIATEGVSVTTAQDLPVASDRLSTLEAKVEQLEADLRELRTQLAQLSSTTPPANGSVVNQTDEDSIHDEP